jgi:hypothetical protein
VQAVRESKIDDSEFTGERNRRFCAPVRQHS